MMDFKPISKKEKIENVSEEYSAYLQSCIGNISSLSPTIMTVGVGSGHRSILMHDFAAARGFNPVSIVVDYDTKRYNDVMQQHSDRFEYASSFNKVHRAAQNGKMALIVDKFPELRHMSGWLNKVDFMVCSDIVMSVPLNQFEKGMIALTRLLKPHNKGQLLLGFSTDRPRKHRLATDFRHRVSEIDNIITEISELNSKRLEHIHDSTRPFSRHYRLITKTL